MNMFSKVFLVVLVCLLIYGCQRVTTSQNAVSPQIVSTKNGPLQGVIKESRSGQSYVAFLGIRFVNPPLRFEPPEPLHETWSEPKVADTLGSECLQFGFANGGQAGSEDCLFMNVYVPRGHLESNGSPEGLPVMVWVHGGGFAFGDGGSYKPDYFMDDGDVIVITFNYRLDLFGFINLEDDVITANNGLRDQVAALKWVQENISAFKGNPSAVTIYGNSAGSASVHYLLLSPLSRGLYSRAIMQSGSVSFWSYSKTPRDTAVKLAHHLKCKLTRTGDKVRQSRDIRRCLEGKTAAELVAAQLTFWPRWPQFNTLARFLPTAAEPKASAFFDAHPQTLYGGRTEYPNKVPVMVGLTKDEGSTLYAAFVYSSDEDVQALNDNWEEILPRALQLEEFFPRSSMPQVVGKIRDFYFGSDEQVSWDTRQQLSDMYSDSLFLVPVVVAAREMANGGSTVYPYVFNYEGKWNLRIGFQITDLPGLVGHAEELQYLFPHESFGHPHEPNSDDEIFSKRLVALWKSFAKQGKPTLPPAWDHQAVNWTPIEESSAKTSDIRWLLLEKTPKLATFDEWDARVKFWLDLVREHALKVDDASGSHHTGRTEL